MTWPFLGLYLGLFLAVRLLPARYWAAGVEWWFVWQQHWRPKPLASEEVLTALRAAQSGQRPFLANLPEYKFYTALWRQMDQLARQYGTPLRDFWQDLRAALTKDRQFEYKLKRERLNAFMQFGVIIGVTWVFVGFSWHLWPRADYRVWMVMLVAHTSGIFLFSFFYRRQQHCLFAPIERLLRPLYTLSALGQSGLSIKQAVQESRMADVLSTTPFTSLKRQIEHTIEQWQAGISPQATWPEILQDLYFIQQETFVRFLRQVNLLKFLLLIICYLSMYFFYLYALFKSVLIA